MKTIGIIGTRRRDTKEDFELTKKVFTEIYKPDDKICSGLCPKGGDWFAVLISLNLGWISNNRERNLIYNKVLRKDSLIFYFYPTIWLPADWNKYGKAAGPIRNTDIAKISDVIIACVSEDRTGGTEDTIKKFKKFHPDGELRLV